MELIRNKSRLFLVLTGLLTILLLVRHDGTQKQEAKETDNINPQNTPDYAIKEASITLSDPTGKAGWIIQTPYLEKPSGQETLEITDPKITYYPDKGEINITSGQATLESRSRILIRNKVQISLDTPSQEGQAQSLETEAIQVDLVNSIASGESRISFKQGAFTMQADRFTLDLSSGELSLAGNISGQSGEHLQ